MRQRKEWNRTKDYRGKAQKEKRKSAGKVGEKVEIIKRGKETKD